MNNKRNEIIDLLTDKIYEKDFKFIIDYNNNLPETYLVVFNNEELLAYYVLIGISYQELGYLKNADIFYDKYLDNLFLTDEIISDIKVRNEKYKDIDENGIKFVFLMKKISELGFTYKVDDKEYSEYVAEKENKGIIIFAKDIIYSNVKLLDLLMADALNKLNSAKNNEEIFKFFLLEFLISIQKKKMEDLFGGKYIDIIDEEYYNYLKNQNMPKNVLESMKISFQKKYNIYKENINFDKIISEKLFNLILDFLSFIDIQKGTNYQNDDKEVQEFSALLLPFLNTTSQLSEKFIFENYNIK